MKVFGINLKPEVEKPLYWLHLVVIILIVYFLINKVVQPMEITISNVLLGTLFLGIADIIAHTILRLD